MLKDTTKKLSYIQGILDACVAATCWMLAYYIRFTHFKDAQSGLISVFVKMTPLICILTIYFFKKNGLYRGERYSSRYREILAVTSGHFQTFVAVVLALYFFSDHRLSRLTLLLYFILSLFSLLLLRIIIRNILRIIRSKGKNLRHVLLVGDGGQIKNYVESIKRYKDSGICFYGIAESGGQNSDLGIEILQGSFEELKKKLEPDAIVIGLSHKQSSDLPKLLEKSDQELIPTYVLPNLSFSLIGHTIEDFVGIPILSVNQPNIDSFSLFSKRIFDLFLTIPGIILISPVLITIAVLVKITSKGPVFYQQERMGINGKKFNMWKFRSMKVVENQDPGWTVENDPRRTSFGSFLRKTSLDELPQVFNVFLGQMSLVGPRPEQPFFVNKFKSEIPSYMLRHKMKAGITGWAQINGWRGDTSLEKRIECDIYYIKNWSLWLDIKILFLTFFKGFFNKNAY